MVKTDVPDLPAFVFPVVAWGPEAATGSAEDDGIRGFVTPREFTTTYFPETDLRVAWTFVDAEGRAWEAVSSKVAGRGDPWWARRLPRWLHHPRYRLTYVFAERPPVPFDKVKSRLFAAVTANPEAYRAPYGRSRREELRGARSLRDLIKSDEQRAIERLEPTALWWQWLLWEGRCSRLGFLAAVAGMAAAWLAILRTGPTAVGFVALVIVSAVFCISALVRRLHDLRLSGWWMVLWWAWSFICGSIRDVFRDTGGPIVAGWLWWIPTLFLFACLALWPGTRGPNRYGYGRQGVQGSEA